MSASVAFPLISACSKAVAPDAAVASSETVEGRLLHLDDFLVTVEQADGTAWMAFYCLNMLEIALELLPIDPALYGNMVMKFFSHFILIAAAMDRIGEHHDEIECEEPAGQLQKQRHGPHLECRLV